MEHAHPLPEAFYTAAGQPSRPAYISNATNSPVNNVTSPRPYESLTYQTRVLRLRNAGFRAPVISGRRISPVSSPPSQLSEPILRAVNDENSPRTSERRMLYGEDLPPNPVNILQELHNSTRRKRMSSRQGCTIFQDSTSEPVDEEVNRNSWYNDTSNSCSPSPLKGDSVKMKKLRERTLNETTPTPLSSPLAKQIKGGRMARLNLRSTSFEASKYIEHLESQLASVHAKLDSLMSPTTNRARSAKLRALTVETRSLRQEVSGWEKNFEDRVQDEIYRRLEYETGMRLRMQSLEDEMETKDARMRELEWELEIARNKVKEAEGLIEVNLSLEKRIDVLTNLVVQSPTKLDPCSATSSPSKADPSKRTPRPKSMLPRLPSSPGGVRLSLNTNVESTFWESGRLEPSSSISGSSKAGSQSIEEEDEPENPEPMSQTLPPRSFSCATSSFRSMPSLSTRPTSLHSASSLGITSPELQLSTDFDSQTRSALRRRKMRRFPSGACSLKPLILPNTAVTPLLPASAPVHIDSDEPQRMVSNTSFDPTVAFLSRNQDTSPLGTPTQFRQRSATWAYEETMKTLEGNSKHPDCSSRESISLFSNFPLNSLPNTPNEEPFEQQKPKRPRPLSLEKELERANLLSPSQFDDGLMPAEVDASTSNEINVTVEAGQPEASIPDLSCCQQAIGETSSTLKPRGSPRAPIIPSKTASSTAVASGNAFGVLTRLTSLINQVKQSPLVLAQRLLCNAWVLGPSKWSGMGWWLLGPVFRYHKVEKMCAADRKIAEESPSGTFNWQHLSAAASRRRTAEHYFSDCGSSKNVDSHELTFWRPSSSRELASAASVRGSEISATSQSRQERFDLPCPDCVEPSSRQSLRLWYDFSLAIFLAVGVAIKHGPGTLLEDQNSQSFITKCHHAQGFEPENADNGVPAMLEDVDTIELGSSLNDARDIDFRSGERFAGNDIIFAEVLGPADFE